MSIFFHCWIGRRVAIFFMLAGYTTVIICYNIVYNIETTSMFDMAIGRCIEITVGVLCSAVVNAVLFPMHIGPVVKTRVSQTFKTPERF